MIRAIAPVSTRPTLPRFVLLTVAALLCHGRRTVGNVLGVAAPLTEGPITTYQRDFSPTSWSTTHLACCLCRLVALPPPDEPILLAVDETVDGHPGRRV